MIGQGSFFGSIMIMATMMSILALTMIPTGIQAWTVRSSVMTPPCTRTTPLSSLSRVRWQPSSNRIYGVVMFQSTETASAAAAAAKSDDDNDDETTKANNNKSGPRHDVGPAATQPLPAALQAAMQSYQEHQQAAPRMDAATDVRTLIEYNHGFAVISTLSKIEPDYPSGSVVGFAPEPETGRPLFLFSSMSTHTQDLLVNPHCSLTVAAKDFKGAADGRVNLMGQCTRLTDPADIELAQTTYQKKHPGAFWMNFGDFFWYRMTVDRVRYVGGFARAGTCTAEQYATAHPDPISQFGPAIAKHMNEDHMTSTIAMIQHYIPGMKSTDDLVVPTITDATITSVDSLGMYVKVTRDGPVAYLPQQFKTRLPFPRPAVDRKDVKTLIVEMTQAAASAAEGSASE